MVIFPGVSPFCSFYALGSIAENVHVENALR